MPPPYPIRRRPRECKTCLPCRASKVRCDRNVPCGNCVKRNQPANCIYGRPPPDSQPAAATTTTPTATSTDAPQLQYAQQHISQSPARSASFNAHSDAPANPREPYPSLPASLRPHNAAPVSSEPISLPQEEWDQICSKVTAMEEIIDSLYKLVRLNNQSSLPREPQRSSQPPPPPPPSSSRPLAEVEREREREREPSPQPQTVYGPSALDPDSVHVGSRSALADILENSRVSDEISQALPKGDLLADLALGNESAAYPFVDLWSSDPFNFNIAGVCGVLPDDQQCCRYLAFYKDIGVVLYPVLPDVSRLEQAAKQLLQGRARAGGIYRPDPNGPIKPFGVSLAFLGLFFAVLASGCQLSDAPRHERELTSWVYVSCSYHCLRMINYVAQPTLEVVQILLIISNVLSYNMNAGASYTLLGMTERLCMNLGLHVESTQYSGNQQDVRRRIWWAMAFQNSHFSLAYDRPSITMVSQPEIPFHRKSMPGYRSYFETLCRVIQLSLDVLRGRMTPPHPRGKYHEIREYQQRMQRILGEAVPHLRHREKCTTLADHIERSELQLHSSYVISVLCRSALDSTTSHLQSERQAAIREDCIASLISTIEAFVELHSINTHCSRSWISLQRTIASAFLLVANEHGQSHPRTWGLIEQLQGVLTDHISGAGAPNAGGTMLTTANHLTSSLQALRKVSAAFRAGKMKGLSSAVSTSTAAPGAPVAAAMGPPTNSQGVLLPSPPSTEDNPATATSASTAPYSVAGRSSIASANTEGSSRSDWDMQNILGRVSEVMLFPRLDQE